MDGLLIENPTKIWMIERFKRMVPLVQDTPKTAAHRNAQGADGPTWHRHRCVHPSAHSDHPGSSLCPAGGWPGAAHPCATGPATGPQERPTGTETGTREILGAHGERRGVGERSLGMRFTADSTKSQSVMFLQGIIDHIDRQVLFRLFCFDWIFCEWQKVRETFRRCYDCSAWLCSTHLQ